MKRPTERIISPALQTHFGKILFLSKTKEERQKYYI
jgi:hypothetical protein